MKDYLNGQDENIKPKMGILKFITECYMILCTTLITAGLLLISIFGGEFHYKVTFNTFTDLLKKLFK